MGMASFKFRTKEFFFAICFLSERHDLISGAVPCLAWLQTSHFSPAKDFLIWNVVLPTNMKSFSEAAQMELVQFLGLAATEEGQLCIHVVLSWWRGVKGIKINQEYYPSQHYIHTMDDKS